MRGYKSFDGTPHPGDLRHRVQIGYTENVINANGYPEPTDVHVQIGSNQRADDGVISEDILHIQRFGP